MKKTIKELKTCARGSLLGHYGTVIAALLLSQIIITLINIPFDQMLRQGIAYSVPPRIALGLIGSLLISLLSSLFDIGVSYIHLQIARKQPTGLIHIFYPFKNRPDRFLGYSVLLMIVSLICVLPGMLFTILGIQFTAVGTATSIILTLVGSILCVVGCIILIMISLAWALTPYILLDNPNMKVLDSMKLSRSLMKGHKWRLFKLVFSFLGWILFSLLTFGIGLLWIMPYITQTCTWFYLDFITGGPENNQS